MLLFSNLLIAVLSAVFNLQLAFFTLFGASFFGFKNLILSVLKKEVSFNSCAFFLLDARTFFWHFSAMTHVTEISVTTDPQQHAIYVTFGLKTRLE